MKVLIVPDVPNWAIGHLSRVLEKYNNRHTIELFYMGPRDVNQKYVEFKQKVESFKPDLIQYEYFRTAGQLFDIDPHLTRIPSIVHHHNQRDKALWQYDFHAKGVKHIVVHNQRGLDLLEQKGWTKNTSKIQLGIDPKYWQYREQQPEEFTIGSAGRICSWKNEKLILEAAHALQVPVYHMGKMDEPDYWNSIPEEHKNMLRFDFWECSDDQRKEYYQKIGCYVGASDDSRESGTLELLEAMASGVPVITTLSGVAAAICEHEQNCLVVPFNDGEAIKQAVERLKNDPELCNRLRKEAWQMVKTMTEERYAMEFRKLWDKVVYPDFPKLSVIMPTYNRSKPLADVMKYFNEEEDYPNFELIVIDDNSTDDTQLVVEQAKKDYNYPILYINTHKEGYNLAMARNLGAIEADGETLVFCDSRLKPKPGALFGFAEALKHATAVSEEGNKKIWFFGDKGSQKKSFVENFSAVKRDQFINFGMFSERIDKYGGMSQEIRTRWAKQGGMFYYLDTVKAEEVVKSGMNNMRRNEIVDMKQLLYKLYGDQRY